MTARRSNGCCITTSRRRWTIWKSNSPPPADQGVVHRKSDPAALFAPVKDGTDDPATIATALGCAEAFISRFDARDHPGMDALLYVPHVILSGERRVIRDRPGRLRAAFFDDLAASTGWHRTTCQDRRAVRVSPRKVHLLVDDTRDRADGTIASRRRNLWVVTFDDGRWGIRQRSC